MIAQAVWNALDAAENNPIGLCCDCDEELYLDDIEDGCVVCPHCREREEQEEEQQELAGVTEN